jgi:hypothetical protein
MCFLSFDLASLFLRLFLSHDISFGIGIISFLFLRKELFFVIRGMKHTVLHGLLCIHNSCLLFGDGFDLCVLTLCLHSV